MDGARRKLLHMLWRADLQQHLGVFYPVTKDGHSIYVHAKIMIIDDTILRVGSSNLNNRSMGFDSECDLAVEAVPGSGDTRLRPAILSVRQNLLCEHLGVDMDTFSAVMDGVSGSMLKAIERLRGSGRTLKPLGAADIAQDESALAESELLDPECPAPSSRARLVDSLPDVVRKLRSPRIR
jgi:phosphatidylserine/phosphatidylglycerophosphate/cardiolipin synthase-like enzyme